MFQPDYGDIPEVSGIGLIVPESNNSGNISRCQGLIAEQYIQYFPVMHWNVFIPERLSCHDFFSFLKKIPPPV